MTDDPILEMAIKASRTAFNERQFLVNFAALVAAHEREECAKLCRDKAGTDGYDSSTAVYLSEDIRARGNQ